LARRVRPFDGARLAEDARPLVPLAAPEIAEQPVAHALGLADVDDAALLREHAVDAGAGGGLLDDAALEGGALLARCGPPAVRELSRAPCHDTPFSIAERGAVKIYSRSHALPPRFASAPSFEGHHARPRPRSPRLERSGLPRLVGL